MPFFCLNPRWFHDKDNTKDDNTDCDESVTGIQEETVEWKYVADDVGVGFVFEDAGEQGNTVSQTQSRV